MHFSEMTQFAIDTKCADVFVSPLNLSEYTGHLHQTN